MKVDTNNGYSFFINKKDYDKVLNSRYSTIYVKDNTKHKYRGVYGTTRYVMLQYYINNKPVRIQLHRFILGLGKYEDGGVIVDHKDGDGLNNMRRNLRSSNQSQNGMNRAVPLNNKTGYKGVSFDKVNNKYRATINTKEKGQISLGRFKTPEEAAISYNDAVLKYFGDFGYLNKIRNK